MKTSIACSTVAGVATATPRATTDVRALNPEWSAKEVENILANTGITHLRVAPPHQTAADLCEAAARSLLAALRFDARDVDGVVFVSQTPDHLAPPTSAILQHKLGIGRGAAAFDINYGCSGYVYGLLQADLMIHAGLCRAVLVLAGDVITRHVNPRDRALRVLFGDAGSATLVVAGADRHSYWVRTDGSGARSLVVPAGGARIPRDASTREERADKDGNVRCAEDLYMDGVAVLYMALRDVPEAVAAVTALHGWRKDEPTFYGLHQANRFLLDYLRRRMDLDRAGAPFSSADVGNTGPASIPLVLAREHARLAAERRLEKSVLCGFGVGFSSAAVALPLDRTAFLDLVELE